MSAKKIVLLVICGILLILILAAAVIGIDISRDISGKKRSSEHVSVIEVSSGDSTRKIAQKLKDSGVIRYSGIFVYMASMQEVDKKLQIGTYEFHNGESYQEILHILKQAPNYRPSVRITFTEGMEVSDIIARFLENGIGTQAGFDAAVNYDFGLSYLPAAGTESRLEGFLYPDTYDFFLDDTEVNVLLKLLNRFSQMAANADLEAKANAAGLSVYEAVTLGSIIQKEAGKTSDFALVSSVFHNRLKIDMLLQSDATVSYMIPKSERLPSCTAAQLQQDTPYNVYLHKGLPPTPICSPSIDAVIAACEPAESEYLYFIGTPAGETVFAVTYSEHQNNIKQYLKQ